LKFQFITELAQDCYKTDYTKKHKNKGN